MPKGTVLKKSSETQKGEVFNSFRTSSMALLCIKIYYKFLGDVAQWESACIASRRSGVQIPSSPLIFKKLWVYFPRIL
jgi:hypothetical protein